MFSCPGWNKISALPSSDVFYMEAMEKALEAFHNDYFSTSFARAMRESYSDSKKKFWYNSYSERPRMYGDLLRLRL